MHMNNFNRFVLFIIYLTLLTAGVALAGQKSWKGTVSTTPTWSQSGNWAPSGVPASTDTVTIGDGSFTGSNQPTINSAVTIAALTFSELNASTLTLQNGGAGSLAITHDLTYSPPNNSLDQTVNVNDRTLTVQGSVLFGA